MAWQTCGHSCKTYSSSSTLSLEGSIVSKFSFLLKNINKLFELYILSEYPILFLDVTFIALSVTKYKKKVL